MNQRPPNPFRPRQVLTADDVSSIAEAAWRGAQQSAAGNAQLSRPGGGPPVISGVPTRRVYARITGQGSSGAFSGASGVSPATSTAGENCYSGIEQTSDMYGRVEDLEDGLNFDSFAFPLVEMTGRTDVPVDAIVWASPSINGQNYEFIWEGAEQFESGSGGTCVDPGPPPEGWTESDDACYEDTIEIRCNGGTDEYRRVRTFLIHGRFRTWTGPWGVTNPPDEP